MIDSKSPPMDDHGHGTSVTSLLSKQVPNLNIMPVKVLDKGGNGDTETLVRGIFMAIEHGARIMLLSNLVDHP